MNLFYKIKGYFIYKKVIKNNWETLKGPNYKMTKDWFTNIGTVINIPQDILDYESTLAKTIIIDYVKKCEKLFYNLNIGDMVKPIESTKIDDLNYKVVFGYIHLKNWQIGLLGISKYLIYVSILLLLAKFL